MARVVLFLDQDTETTMRAAAKSAGVSESQWVADLIRKNGPEEDTPSERPVNGAWKRSEEHSAAAV